ncbi:hypothetical protein ACS0TY_004847 [Phlomoides rotata]
MEDQQDVVGNSPSESLVKNMGSENQVAESFGEGDGGEIMVEVVGSDVFVDGISGDKEVNLESGKVGDLEDKIKESQIHNVSEAMDVSSEGDGNKVGKSVVGPPESKDEKHFVAREEVDTTLCKSVDVKGDVVSALPPSGVSVVDDEVWNPGIEAIGGSSSAGTVPNSEVIEASPMEIVEEKITEAEAVTKDGAASEGVLDEKTEIEEKKEVLPPSVNTASHDQFSSAATVPNSEVIGASPMVIDGEKITVAVTNDGATSESLDRSTEAVLDEKTEIEEKKEVLPSSDNTVSHDQCSSTMPVSNSEVIGASPMVIGEEKITGAVTKDGATSESLNHSTEAVLDDKTEIQEKKEVLPSSGNAATDDQLSSAVPVLNSASPMVIDEEKMNEAEAVIKDGATSESLDRPTEVVLDEKTEIEEKKEVLPSSDNTASHDQFSSAATVPNSVISEDTGTEDEVVTKECADLVTTEPLNHPEETDLDEKTDIEEKKEVLPSTDDSAKSAATDEVTGLSPVVISEETRTEDEAFTKECSDLVTPVPLNHPEETDLDEKTDIEEKKEVLPSPDDSEKCVAADEVTGPSPVVISEETRTKDETVTKECSDLVTPVPLNHPEETDLDERTDIEEKKEVMPSPDDSAKCAVADEVTGLVPVVISEETRTEDEAVTKECSDLVTPVPLNHPEETDLDERTDTEEKKEVLPSPDDSAKCAAADEVTGLVPVVISEETRTEDEAVTKECGDLVTPEPLNHPEETDLDEKTDIEEKKEVLTSPDDSVKCAAADEVTGPSPVVISEETSTEDEAVTKECADLVTPEPLNHPEKIDLNEKTDTEEKKEVLSSNDDYAKCVATDEVTGPSTVVISEEKSTVDEAVNMDIDDLVTPEPISHPAEADSGIADIDKKEVSPSSDNSANRDHVDADSVMSHEETKAAQGGVESPDTSLNLNVESLENVQDDGIDSAVGEADSVDASSGQELPEFCTQDYGSFRAKAELATTDGDGSTDEKSVDHTDVFAAESKTSILESDAQASDVQDENQGCTKLESDDRVDDVSHAGLESIHESSSGNNKGEATGNGKCLWADSELETHKAHENRVFSGEPNELTYCSVTDVVDSNKSLNVEIHSKSSSCPSDKEIVKADSGMYSDQPVDKTLDAEVDGHDAVMSQLEVVDGDGSCEKVEEIKSEIPAVDDSVELVEEGVCSKVEKEDLMAVENHAVGHDAIVNSEGIDNVVQECGLPQSTKQEVSEQTIETSNHEVDEFENINSMPNEVVSVAPISDTAQVPEITEKAESVEEITSLENMSSEEDHEPRECNGFGTSEDHTSETKVVDVKEEQESDHMYNGEKEVAEGPSEAEKLKSSTEGKLKHTSSFRMSQLGYLTPTGKEGSFAQSDLVWGKVRSHPWWPGQIFDPDVASEKAVKYHKKDSYLVAYFGDQTFAWNDSSALKPFRPHFSQIEKQSSSEAFHNAVNCALEEVERRVALGLSCSCIPKDAYAMIETQVVENTGIREEASIRFGVDRSTQASHFEPNKLLDYITGLAPRASSRVDRLDLVIARAQLAAYFRFTGYRSLAEYPSGELLESDVDTAKVSDEAVASHKRKHVPKGASQSKKEKSSVELMVDREYSPDAEDEFGADDFGKSVPSSGKKRKALDPLADGSEKRITVYSAKVSSSATQAPKPSFKIGECIRRVASQLTGSTPSIKGSNDETVIDGTSNIHEQSEKQSAVVPIESLSVSELLSQIELVAQGPMKRHGFQNNIRAFFLGFRSSVAINRRARKKKSEQTVGGSGEEFEFDDVNDSYWTDRIVQNYPEGQLPHEGENGTPNHQVVPFTGEKPVKTGRKPHSRKRVSSAVSPTVPTVEDENAKRIKQESSPAELILSFAERNRVPSEINLNKMFRRFGPLMESETEVDHEYGCAKVIFKRGSDAEVARNSAEKFSIFGPALVNYHVGYSPVISVKILPVAMPQPQEDEALMTLFDVDCGV